MNKTINLIDDLSNTTKRKEKEQLLIEAFMTGERTFFVGAKMAYDYSVTYGVKMVAEILEDDGMESDLTFPEFCTLANKLKKRILSGNAAKDAIHEAAGKCDFHTWNKFYRKILLKDLRIGVEVGTINKILKKLAPSQPDAKDYIVPVFECQLAQDGVKHHKKITGKKLLDVKLDGVRILTFLDKDANKITQYSRNGQELENFPHIKTLLIPFMDALPQSVVLDGEIMGENFQALMKQLRRKTDVDTSNCSLNVFDMIPMNDFLNGHCSLSQIKRHEALAAVAEVTNIKTQTNGRVLVMPKMLVDFNTEEGQAAFKEFNRTALLEKYEGVMVKDPHAPYEAKRTFSWLKVKPFIEVTLTVVGVEEGDPEGENKGRLGALVCHGFDDGIEIKTNVAGGISDADRELWWANPDLIIGMVVEVKADAITNSPNNEYHSLRFASIKGIRGREKGEKL